jgi:DNA-binding beta-propeller fold protein YncE
MPVLARRTFLKLSSAGAAGAVVTGSVGCGGGGAAHPPVAAAPPGALVVYGAGSNDPRRAVSVELYPWQHQLRITDAHGVTTAVGGGPGTAPGLLNAPAAAAIGPADGLVYVADRGNHRVQVFTARGALVRTFGAWGQGDGELAYPAGLAFDARGRLWVSDTRNHRLAAYTAEGTLRGYVTQGSEGVGLQAPLALTAGTAGTLHVLDAGNRRVQVLDAGGAPRRAYGAGRLQLPQSLAVDGLGQVYVGDVAASAVLVFDAAGGYQGRMALADRLAPVPHAFAPDGVLHVSGAAPV